MLGPLGTDRNGNRLKVGVKGEETGNDPDEVGETEKRSEVGTGRGWTVHGITYKREGNLRHGGVDGSIEGKRKLELGSNLL